MGGGLSCIVELRELGILAELFEDVGFLVHKVLDLVLNNISLFINLDSIFLALPNK